MLVFKKKIYLLIVFFNSIQIIFESIKIVFFFIVEQVDKSTGAPINLHDYFPEPLFILGGLLDMTSLFLLINVLPALLALKYKGGKFEITMAGTLIGLVMCGAFVFGAIIQTACTPLYESNGNTFDGKRRLVFCTLLILSNVPYLEWAHLEWLDIWKEKSKQVQRD